MLSIRTTPQRSLDPGLHHSPRHAPPRPFRRRAALIAITALCASLLSAVPAPARPAAAGCTATDLAQVFAPWLDMAEYTLAPGGDLEDGGTSWTLGGAAAVVEGNEPFHVGDPSDHRSLALAADSWATTSPMCIGVEHRTIRFFARKDRADSGPLLVDALFTTTSGTTNAVRVASVAGTASWSPTQALIVIVNHMAAAQDNALTMRWRFRSQSGSSWSIDDIYVDPFRSR